MLSITAGESEPAIQQISWNGQNVDAYAGRWIVGIDNSGISNLLTATGVGIGAGLGAAAQAAANAQAMSSPYSPLAKQAVETWLQVTSGASGISVLRSLGEAGHQRFYQLESSVTSTFAQLQSTLSQLPGFKYVEPDFVMSATATIPNDSQFSSLWGMNNTGQTGGVVDADIDAPEAWDLTTGSSDIVIGVIDTGVDYTHPDLAANIWTNPGEIAGDGIDNDNNGFVDDVHGWDFVNDDSDPMDDNDHGTHCAGTIGGTGNNGTGVAGVNWNVSIMALKYLGSSGHGSTSDAVDALNYATMMRRDHGINIRATSNSWGGGGYSQALFNAISATRDQDMLFIAAAGNGDPDGIGDDNDGVPFYPATYDLDNIISVAATNDDDLKAGFSNYGATTVDLGAPGVSIRSTIAGGGYANFQGTSMATPHVAGVAALAWSIAPTASYQTIKDAILGGVDHIASMDGITVSGGRLNAYGTLQQLGMRVASTNPAFGSVVTTQPTSFVVNFSNPYVPGTIDASDFTVNGIPADSFTLTDSDTVTFQFLRTPVSAQGVQTMAVADGAVTRASDLASLHAFSNYFRYDALPLAVTATSPVSGSTTALPLTALTVTFNEAFDPTTVNIDDLTINQGTVTGFNIAGNTVTYTIAGLLSEGTLSFSLKAGSLTDGYGNPLVAYSGSTTLDFGVVPMPGSPTAVGPGGNQVYQSTASGSVGFVGDTDTFTLALLAGQVLTFAADPAAGLRPTVELRDASDVVVASGTAAAAGKEAIVQTFTVPSSGTYKVTVSGNSSTTGTYTLTATLNSAIENESHDGATNDTSGTAQNLNAGFINVGSGASISTVVGQVDAALSLLPSEVESNNTTGTANSAIYNFAAYSSNLYQLAISGTISSSSDSDWFSIGAMQTSDIISLTASGSPTSRGTLTDPVIELYRGSTASPTLVTSDDNNGPGNDSQVYRFTIPAADNYFIRVRPSTTQTGTYQLAAWLENGGAAPSTGGTLTTETESNNSAATANNASTSWRKVNYRSHTTGTATLSDSDFYRFTLTAGDVITVVADSTSTMDARVALLNSGGTVIASEDGNSVGPGVDSYIYSYRIPTTGTYYVRVQPRSLTGAYSADVYLSTTTPPPISPANPDWYAFDLTAGQRVSLALGSLTTANVDLVLANPSGVDIATGTAATSPNEVIQQFIAPTTGTYYARVNGTPNTPYSLSIVRGAAFDTEANDAPTGALQDLTQVGTTLGYLNLNRPAFTAPVALTIDHDQSSVTISADVEGVPFIEQSPGSLTTHYQGTLKALITGNTIQFSGGSSIDADVQPGLYLPGNVTADYAGKIEVLEGLFSYGIFRNLVIDATTGILPVDEFGHFDANKITTTILSGDLNYSIPTMSDQTYSLEGLIANNETDQPAVIEEIDGVLYVTMPVAASDSILEPSSGIQFNISLTGQIKASLVLPPPIDPDDYYQVTLAPGERLTLSTQTPLDVASAGVLNSLDPSLELLDASNAVVANDANSALDGKNATLEYTSLSGGTYKIHVRSTAGQGEYVLTTSIAQPNQAPLLDPISDQSIAEGSTLSFTAQATDPDLNALTFSLQAGSPVGATIDPNTGLFSWTAGDDAVSPFSITVIVTDNGVPQLSASRTFLVTVNNVAPTASAGGPYVISEGQDLHLSGSGVDPIDSLTYSWDLNNDGDFSDVTGASPTVSWSLLQSFGIDNGPGAFSVKLRVDDGDGGVVDSLPATLTLNNSPPVVNLSGPTSALRGELLTFSFAANDPSNADQAAGFSFFVDWGDGSPVQQVGANATHAYNTAVTANLTVYAKDQNGAASAVVGQTVQVDAIRTSPNAQNPALVDLIWSGTSGNDRVQLEQISPTTIRIHELTLNGTPTGTAQDYTDITGRVIVRGQGGDDELDARTLASTQATLDGGANNNTLYGGPAGDVLIGGSNGGEGHQGNNVIIAGNGNNTIYGNSVNGRKGSSGGNNLIVGGTGNDTIYGNFGTNPTGNGGEGGQNLIVGGDGGDTIYASQVVDGAEGGHGSILVAGKTQTLDQTALLSVLSEWTSTRTYAEKVANISGTGSGPRNNGSNFLVPGVTLSNDGAADQLFSDTKGALNWLLYTFGQDTVNRVKSGETQTHAP